MAIDPGFDDFSWVDAVEACSYAKVFVELRAGVEEDVTVRNRQLGQNSFGVTAPKPESFTVYRDNPTSPNAVRFDCAKGAIRAVALGGGPDIIVRLKVNMSGHCRLVIKKQEYEQWEFRKMALEGLFFAA
jgi:hypothetical protein